MSVFILSILIGLNCGLTALVLVMLVILDKKLRDAFLTLYKKMGDN